MNLNEGNVIKAAMGNSNVVLRHLLQWSTTMTKRTRTTTCVYVSTYPSWRRSSLVVQLMEMSCWTLRKGAPFHCLSSTRNY